MSDPAPHKNFDIVPRDQKSRNAVDAFIVD